MKAERIHAEILVRMHGGTAIEGMVHSIILREGASVGNIERRTAADGSKDLRISMFFDGTSLLNGIVHALGAVQGASVLSYSLLGVSRPKVRSGEHLR